MPNPTAMTSERPGHVPGTDLIAADLTDTDEAFPRTMRCQMHPWSLQAVTPLRERGEVERPVLSCHAVSLLALLVAVELYVSRHDSGRRLRRFPGAKMSWSDCW